MREASRHSWIPSLDCCASWPSQRATSNDIFSMVFTSFSGLTVGHVLHRQPLEVVALGNQIQDRWILGLRLVGGLRCAGFFPWGSNFAVVPFSASMSRSWVSLLNCANSSSSRKYGVRRLKDGTGIVLHDLNRHDQRGRRFHHRSGRRGNRLLHHDVRLRPQVQRFRCDGLRRGLQPSSAGARTRAAGTAVPAVPKVDVFFPAGKWIVGPVAGSSRARSRPGEQNQHDRGDQDRQAQTGRGDDRGPTHPGPQFDTLVVGLFTSRYGHGNHLPGANGRSRAITGDAFPVVTCPAAGCATGTDRVGTVGYVVGHGSEMFGIPRRASFQSNGRLSLRPEETRAS